MPTENENKVNSLIDVGEEEGAEINLDDKGEPEKVEAPAEDKIEVEQVPEDKSFENERETKLEKKDEVQEYSEGVQKRIAKLTRKMREAERQKEEAIAFAESTNKQKSELEGRLSRLDKSYTSEFETRVKTNMTAARQALKTAIESQDVEGQIAAQEQLDKARIATTCGYVLKMGDLAYADKTKFGKPWCKVGDWVMFARYAGARLPIEGGEVRILNDDEVLGTIGDPESVLHYI